MEKNIRHVRAENKETGLAVLNRVIEIVFGLIEIVLGFRLIFKILGANPGNGFVSAIYAVTAPLVGLFEGIFSNVSLGGEDPERVLEPGAIIAIIVIAIIAWILHRLAYSRIRNRTEQIEYTGPPDQPNNNNKPQL